MADEYEEENEQALINVGTYDGPRNELGEREGRGRSVYANKDVYVGDFKAGIREGNGTYRWAYLGMKYRGEYKNGVRNGKGTMWYTNGAVYEGDWVDGRRQGHGRIEYPNLDVYEGEWQAGLPSGEGKYYYFSCDAVAQGTFEFGRIVRGELQLRDGSKWVGEFYLNQPFGKGYWIRDSWKQDGEFVEINPPQPEEQEEENEEPEEDIDKSIQEEAQEDEEQMEKLREEADKEAAEEAGEEDGEPRKKVDPREKTLRALLPPKRTRMTL